MKHKGKDALVAGLVLGVLTAVMVGGCGRLRVGVADGRGQHPVESSSEQGISEFAAESAERGEALAAIEEFLERTEDYRLAETAAEGKTARAATEPEAASEVGVDVTSEPSAARADAEGAAAPPRREAFANTQVALVEALPATEGPELPVVESVSIRSPKVIAAASAPPAVTKTTNRPLDTQTSGAPPTVDEFLRELESFAKEAGGFDAEWQLRLTRLALERDANAPVLSSEMSPDARSILDSVIEVADAARRVARDPLAVGEDAVTSAQKLTHVLADRADPIVPVIALCRRVVTFGVYDEMGEEDFTAGRSTPTIVYCEVRNFRSEMMGESRYRTVLGTRLEVLTSDGQSVWQHEEPEIVDLCRRRRTDFFIAQRTTLPPTLSAGEYVLKVLVEDKLSGKASEAVHQFRVGSPTSVAVGR